MTKQLIVTLGVQLVLQVAFYVHFYLLAKRQARQELELANVTQILQAQCEQEDKIQLLAREIAGIRQAQQELAKSKEQACTTNTKAVAKTKATASKATNSTTKTTVKKSK